jgi:hypothetical protein
MQTALCKLQALPTNSPFGIHGKHLKFDINDKNQVLCKLPYCANYKPCQQTPPLALMEKFKSLLPLLTSMAKESTILPLSKENHLQRCIISAATPPINNSQ